MFGEIVGRVFIGPIGSWTIHRFVRMLVLLALSIVSTFGVVEKSFALTAGVTCAAVEDADSFNNATQDSMSLQRLRRVLDCSGTTDGLVQNTNIATASHPLSVLLNTNNDGSPAYMGGVRIDYFAPSITEVRVDGALYAAGTTIGAATTAGAFSHTVQYKYAGNTYSFVTSKDAGTNTLKAFTVVLVSPAITGGANVAVNVAEGQTAVTNVESTDDSDAEGSGLTYALTGGADQAKFSIDANAGVLTFVAAPDFETPADVGTDNTYDVQVTVTDSGGLTDVQDIVVTVTDLDEVAPGVTILGEPSSTDGATSFDITVKFNEDVTGFVLADITVGNGIASNFVAVDANTYIATITPSSKAIVTLDVAANVAIDGAGNGNEAATQVVVRDATVEDTQKVIGQFMQHRASAIANLQPDIAGFVIGAEGSHDFFISRSNQTLNYAGSTTLNAANQGINDSFAANENVSREGNFDVWTQLHAANTNAGDATNKLWLGYAGAHYFLSDDMLVGALVQIDYAEGTNPVAGSSIDGTGWMVGPYVAGKVPNQDIYYEARASWGESYNNVSPYNTYTDRFDTERWMVSGKLTGDYEFGDITFSPNVSLAYFSEEQRAYIDSLSNPIPSQSIASGELRFGPAISKAFTLNDGAILTPKVGISGIYTIVATSSNSALDLTFDQGNFRAQLALGLSLATIHGATIGTDLFYDGLGVENYQTWGGNMNLRVPLQ